MQSVFPVTKRIASLDGLRFFAAMCVVFGHIPIVTLHFNNIWANWFFFEMRAVGMSLFFILSGFVISVNYPILGKMGCSLRLYFIHRFSRIYPLFLLIFIYELLFAYDFQGEIKSISFYKILGFYLSLTHAWFYDKVGNVSFTTLIFGVSWSLSVEFFFYFAYPFIQTVFKNLDIRNFKITLFFFIIIFFLLLFMYYEVSFPEAKNQGLSFDSGEIMWFIYFSPYLSIFEFIIGCMVGRIYLQSGTELTVLEKKFRKWFLLVAIGGPVFLYIIFVYRIWALQNGKYEAFFVLSRGLSPFLAYLVFYTARYVQVNRRKNLLIGLGDLSYPIYLIHWTFFSKMFGKINWNSWLMYGITVVYMVVFLLFFSYGLLKWYDQPVRAAVRRGLTRLFRP